MTVLGMFRGLLALGNDQRKDSKQTVKGLTRFDEGIGSQLRHRLQWHTWQTWQPQSPQAEKPSPCTLYKIKLPDFRELRSMMHARRR